VLITGQRGRVQRRSARLRRDSGGTSFARAVGRGKARYATARCGARGRGKSRGAGGRDWVGATEERRTAVHGRSLRRGHPALWSRRLPLAPTAERRAGGGACGADLRGDVAVLTTVEVSDELVDVKSLELGGQNVRKTEIGG
jgi:hypothetical protein